MKCDNIKSSLLCYFRETLNEKLQEAHHTNQGFALQQLDLAMKSRTDNINNKVNA